MVVQGMLSGNGACFEMVPFLTYKKRQVVLSALQGILRFVSCKHNSFSCVTAFVLAAPLLPNNEH